MLVNYGDVCRKVLLNGDFSSLLGETADATPFHLSRAFSRFYIRITNHGGHWMPSAYTWFNNPHSPLVRAMNSDYPRGSFWISSCMGTRNRCLLERGGACKLIKNPLPLNINYTNITHKNILRPPERVFIFHASSSPPFGRFEESPPRLTALVPGEYNVLFVLIHPLYVGIRQK